MILAFDSYYSEQQTKTVCIAFRNWTDEVPVHIYSEITDAAEPYVPGEFYKRELPCILSLLQQTGSEQAEAIIIDGFVVLDDAGKPGLGMHLSRALDGKIPIIGVAKTSFFGLDKLKTGLLRGDSKRPLYITATGMQPAEAAEKIRIMNGPHRVPVLLKMLDRLTKE